MEMKCGRSCVSMKRGGAGAKSEINLLGWQQWQTSSAAQNERNLKRDLDVGGNVFVQSAL